MQSNGRQVTDTEASEDRPQVRHFGSWLALVAAVGFGLRIVVVILSRGDQVNGDGYEWSKQGNLDAAGHWFVSAFNLRPDALRPPGWALALTVWAWFGQHSWFHQQILSCLIGAGTVAMIGLVGRRLAGDRTALVAAGIAAVYAGLWVYERALLSEVLLLLGVTIMILLAYRFRDRPSVGRAAVLGGMCGVLALIRSEQILVLPLLVLPLILAAKGIGRRQRITWLALSAM